MAPVDILIGKVTVRLDADASSTRIAEIATALERRVDFTSRRRDCGSRLQCVLLISGAGTTRWPVWCRTRSGSIHTPV